METQDQEKRDGNKWRGEQPWAGLATSSPRAGNLIYPSPVVHPSTSPQGKGKGCTALTPPGPETLTAKSQRQSRVLVPGTSNSP